MKFVFDEQAFDAFVSNPNGGVAGELEKHGRRAAVIARVNVDEQYPRAWVHGNDPPWHLNPPTDGAFPMRRSGELQASINVSGAVPDPGDTIMVEVGAMNPPTVENFAFSTNNKNGRAFPGVPYALLRMDQLAE